MQYISATDAKQKLAAMLDAAQIEPITIRRQNRDAAVVLSPKEFERLRGLNIQEFEAFCDQMSVKAEKGGLTEEILGDLLNANQ